MNLYLRFGPVRFNTLDAKRDQIQVATPIHRFKRKSHYRVEGCIDVGQFLFFFIEQSSQ